MNDARILNTSSQFQADCRRDRWDRIIGGATVIALGVMLGSMPWWEAIA
ncbi:hypothetical protein GS534_00865 [Rhodococcus hoagii]|nr:hypothetical protein [Prescottella equi]